MKEVVEGGDSAPGSIDPEILSAFEVTRSSFIERTAIASIWRVQRADGTDAAPKIYHRKDMRNEAAGFDWLVAQDGLGKARLYGRCGHAVLMEWLGGPSLGDMARAGQIEQADATLVELANSIHQKRCTPFADLPMRN